MMLTEADAIATDEAERAARAAADEAGGAYMGIFAEAYRAAYNQVFVREVHRLAAELTEADGA
jgi:hypothetical protein